MTERSVECSQCKKAAKILYKEMVGQNVVVTEMCEDCPILQKKLKGEPIDAKALDRCELPNGLVCGKCHTPLEAVKMGNPLGCSECYNVFGELLVTELSARNKTPKQQQRTRRNQPLHIGKSPDKQLNMPSANRLTELNVALNSALQQENYEEAAWVRDQINELMGKKDEPKS